MGTMVVVDLSLNVYEISNLHLFFRLPEIFCFKWNGNVFVSSQRNKFWLISNYDKNASLSNTFLGRPFVIILVKNLAQFIWDIENNLAVHFYNFSTLLLKLLEARMFSNKHNKYFCQVYNWQNILFKSQKLYKVHICCIMTFPRNIYMYK